MRFDFSGYEYFDDHTHLLFTDRLKVTPEEFAVNYYHGVRDIKDKDGKPGVSPEAVRHLRRQSVIKYLLHEMHRKFGCDETLEAAAELRNSMTKTPEALAAYTRLLFEDENITGCMLDAAEPMDSGIEGCFPCRVYRLFRYEDEYFRLLDTAPTFGDLTEALLARVRKAKEEGFAGLKGHIGEKCGFGARSVSDGEAEAAFEKAKARDPEAMRTVYYAMFGHLLELAGEIGLPVHLHTGTTGFKGDTAVSSLDPLLMAPFLDDDRYRASKIVFIHGSFPMSRSAAWMAYNFPNVYIDLSQTQLWQAYLLPDLLRDALSIAPHDKIMLGTGQHWYCEMVWLASKAAKRSLEKVMSDYAELDFISLKDAEKTAAMVLSENAYALYGR